MATYNWPGSVSSNPSVGANGATAPDQSTEIGGVNPEGNLTPVSVDDSGNVNVNVANFDLSAPMPIDIEKIEGAAPSATNSVPTRLTNGAAFYDASDIRPLTSSDVVTAEVSSSVLPTGAATDALQTTGNGVLGSILIDLTNGTQVTQITGTVPLPTGAATEATLSALNTKVTKADTDHVTISTALPAGSSLIGKVGIDQTTPGTTNGVQVNAALPAGTNLLGKMGIDQTTPGTTNGVQINAALPAGTNNIGSTNAISTTPTAKTITQAAITVGTSAVRCTVSGSAPASSRVSLVVTPDPASAATFYIGSSSVTTTSTTRGAPIVAGQSFIANLDAGDYYIISSSAAQTVFIVEQA